jgi:hypothetical protein
MRPTTVVAVVLSASLSAALVFVALRSTQQPRPRADRVDPVDVIQRSQQSPRTESAGLVDPSDAGVMDRIEVQKLPDLVPVSELPKSAMKHLNCVNRVLKAAGEAEIAADATIRKEDIPVLEAICASDNAAINDADRVLMDIQSSQATEMVKTLQDCAAKGLAAPYENITHTGMPRNPHRYDRFVTTSFNGALFLYTLPHSKEVMDGVDRLSAANESRLANIRTIIRPLFNGEK